jgi:hypothetical protein
LPIGVSKSQSVAPEGRPPHSVKIRVHGAEGPAAQKVLDKLHGQIGQFLGKNQQQVKLSGLEQYAAKKAVPGGHLHYHNNQGQETLDVHVEHEEGEEEKKEEIVEYWQWAIVETTIPGMTLTSAEMAAIMHPKPNTKIGATWEENFVYDFEKPPLAYPGDVLSFADQLQTLSGQSDQVSSLRVDLRPYPGGVKFDLYGYIHPYTDPDAHGDATASFLRAGRRANTVTATSGTWTTPNGGTGAFPNSTDIAARTIGNVRNVATQAAIEAQFPETVGLSFTGTTQSVLNSEYQQQGPSLTIGGPGIAYGPSYVGRSFTWTPGSGNMPDASSLDIAGSISAAGGAFVDTATYWDIGGTIIAKHRGLGYVTVYANFSTGFADVSQGTAGPVDANGNWGFQCYDYTSYHLATFGPAPLTYPTRAGPIKFAVFDGEEPNGYTQLTSVGGGFGSRKRWEDKKRGIGKRWPFKQIAVANIRSIDDPADTSLANNFGMPKIGTVIINPRKGKGGIKFIAA